MAGALPRKLAALGERIQVVSPLYQQVDRQRYIIDETGVSGAVRIGYTSHPYQLLRHSDCPDPHLECLFIHNRYFFQREGVYTTAGGEGFTDNNQRFFFFQKVLADLIIRGILKPDIIHVNDHHTALLPFLLRNRRVRRPSLLTVHNFQYQGDFSSEDTQFLSEADRTALDNLLPGEPDHYRALEIGLRTAGHANTVSPTYARELLADDEMAFGLQAILLGLGDRFSGILNGADYSCWNPAVDKLLPRTYSLEDRKLKQVSKQSLRERCGLDYAENTPIIGSISRLVETKGFDLIIDIMGRLASLPCQLVFLGTGYARYEDDLRQWAEQFPRKISFISAYDEPLAHLIEAGSDLFLMPSRYEPCGLNQIYSLKYGTLPIVHRTGGLADTVRDCRQDDGNGFVFDQFTAEDLLAILTTAVDLFRHDQSTWDNLQVNAMQADYSWEKSAREYRRLYQSLLPNGEQE